MSAHMDQLERQYRRALLFYPTSWRRQHGDVLLGVLMDVAADDQRPGTMWRQILSLCGNGLLARVIVVIGWLPVDSRTRVAVGATVIGVAAAATMMVLGELGRWFRYGSYGPDVALFGPFTSAASLIHLLWLVAFSATVLRLRGLRATCHSLVIATAILVPVITALTGISVAPAWYVPAFFALASSLALLGDPSRINKGASIMLWSSPLLAAGITFAAYRLGAGSRMTFYGYKGHSWDQFPVSATFIFLIVSVAALTVSSGRSLPWVTYLVVFALPLLAWFAGIPISSSPSPVPSFLASSVLAAGAAWLVARGRPLERTSRASQG